MEQQDVFYDAGEYIETVGWAGLDYPDPLAYVFPSC